MTKSLKAKYKVGQLVTLKNAKNFPVYIQSHFINKRGKEEAMIIRKVKKVRNAKEATTCAMVDYWHKRQRTFFEYFLGFNNRTSKPCLPLAETQIKLHRS